MVSLVLTLFFALQTGAAQAVTPGGLITGRVVDAETGRPVATAIMSLEPGAGNRGAAIERVLTDATGRYYFSRVAKGSYSLLVSKPGWVAGAYGRQRPDGESTSLAVEQDETRADLELKMWRYAVIEGSVTDDAAEPIVDVAVRAFRRQIVAGQARYAVAALGRTDDRGAYRLPNLTPGEYLIAVVASVASEPPGFADSTPRDSPAAAVYLRTMTSIGAAPLVITRNLTASTASTKDGSLVASTATLTSSPTDGTWMTYATTFYPSSASQSGASIVRLASGQQRTAVDLQVKTVRTFTISGTITDADGPAPFHAVHLVQAESSDYPLFDAGLAVTDASGAFRFYGVTPGAYVVRVVRVPTPPPGYDLAVLNSANESQRIGMVSRQGPQTPAPTSSEAVWTASQSISVSDRAVTGLALPLQPGPRVRGRAEFDGASSRPTSDQLSNVRISLEPLSGAEPELRVMAPGQFSLDGQFVSASMPPGNYYVRVANAPPGWSVKSVLADGRDVSELPLDLRTDVGGIVVTFTDHAARIAGAVVGNTPATVVMFPVNRDAWMNYGKTSRRVASVRATATGAFSMAAPPTDDYFIVAIGEQDAGDWQNPATLEKLAAVAERVQVRDGENLQRELTIKRVR